MGPLSRDLQWLRCANEQPNLALLTGQFLANLGIESQARRCIPRNSRARPGRHGEGGLIKHIGRGYAGVRYMDGRENDGSLERGARPQCSPGSATRQVSRRNPED